MTNPLLDAIRRKRPTPGTEKFENAHPRTPSHLLLKHTPLRHIYIVVPQLKLLASKLPSLLPGRRSKKASETIGSPLISPVTQPSPVIASGYSRAAIYINRIPWRPIGYISIPIIIVAILFAGIFYVRGRPPKAPKIAEAPTNSMYLYETGNADFSARIGTKQSTVPFISFDSKTGGNASFSMVGSQSVEAKQSGSKIVYPNVRPDTDIAYSSILNGIKEEIVLNRATPSAEFVFNLTTSAKPRPIAGEFFSPFFFDSQNNYQFHFEKPFAVDARGNRTEDIAFSIRKSKEKENEYQVRITMESSWLTASNRAYPVTIDPTIIYDTSVEFATGILNRVTDTGSGASPSLETFYQTPIADANTIALWRMDEASGNILDVSGNNHTGVPTGTSVVNGRLGLARFFDGTDDVINITNTTALNPNDYTVEAWIWPTTISATQYNEIIAFAQGSAQFRIEPSTSKLSVWVLGGSWFNVQGATTISTTTWTHVAVVKEGENLYLYVNGKLDGTGKVPKQLTVYSAGAATTIGDFPTGNHRFNGIIDELRLSSIARSTEEIKASASRRPYSIYTSEVIDLAKVSSWNPLSWAELGVTTGDGETIKDSTGLVAQWNFNETSGTSANNDAEGTSCGGTPANCDGTLSGFDSTASQDADPDSSWTANNRRWGTGALQFDGTDSIVTVTDNASLDIAGPISLEVWVNPTKVDSNYHDIISKYAATTNYELRISNTNKFEFGYQDSTPTWDSVLSIQNVVPGKWYHIVGSYDGSAMKIFVNGALDNSKARIATPATNNGNLKIGERNSDFRYTGIIDSTRIYSRALTANEVMSNYTAGNIDIQTRVGSDTSPDDGSWEEWRPITNESQIDTLEDVTAWSVNSEDPTAQNILTNKSVDTNTGNGSDGACSITGTSVNVSTGSCAGRATPDAVSFNLSAPLSGGVTSYSGGYVFHQFRKVGNHQLYVPTGEGRIVDYLVVAGGGGGGMDMGGGGGGGGVRYGQYQINAPQTVSVSVGVGGAGAPAGGSLGQPSVHQFTLGAGNGGSSAFGTVTTVGGGRGGSSPNTYTPGSAGAAGGSGGGASGYNNNATPVAGGTGTAGEGNRGGNQGSAYYSGGGGGGGAAGGDGNNQANGGAGTYNTILDTGYFWGGGGGGAGYSICGGNGGVGGGGGGAVCTTNGGGSALNPGQPGGGGTINSQTNKPGGDGGENTGGGGGGGSHYNANNNGGNGGSGIVVIKYAYTLYPIAAGDTSITMPVTPTGLAVGDDFMIINLQGNPSDNNNVGDYEIHNISAINGNTISFTDYPLRHSYDVTTQRIVLQRVPNYSSVTIGRTPSGNTGASAGTAGYSCLDLKNSGQNADGFYWIDPDLSGSQYAATQVYCFQTRDGGGWTSAVKAWYQSGAMGNTGALGSAVADIGVIKGNPFKLSDILIRAIIGESQNFDLMADQNGYNTAYSTGNFEYVIIRNYTEYFRFDIGMPESRTKTTFESHRVSDNWLASTFNLKCGAIAGAGINCSPLLENNPAGGAYCDVNMGSSTNTGWHHFAMSWYNSDTYLYICNGAQHSSGQNMNHRYWIRERKPISMTAASWDGTKGGLIAFKVNGTLTLNATGSIVADGLGYQGGISTGALWSTKRAFSGDSYAGPGIQCTGRCAWEGTPSFGGYPNFGGGGSGALGAGSGGGYGSPGYLGVQTVTQSYDIYRGLPGETYGDPALNKLFFGSGGGGGGDGNNGTVWGQTAAAKGVGGRGGGIILINANTLSLNNSSAVTAGGTGGTTGWDNIAVNYISGGAGGGGAGGSIKIYTNSATINNDVIRAEGGGSSRPFHGLYESGWSNDPEGGKGGVGRIAINYATSLSGETSPAANTQKIETQKIKIEGSGALNFKPNNISDSTVGLWHFGENTSTKVYICTGADQTYTVPAGVTSVNVKMWGAGGGAGYLGGWTYGFAGGGGGYTTGDIAVTPGQQLIVMAGCGGLNGATPTQVSIYGGGGRNCNTGSDCRYGGAGGGRSAIRFGGVDLLTAGGGGGGGASRATISMHGGAGGGTDGFRGESLGLANCWGNPGTQSAGGSGGVGANANGGAGSQYQGGQPASNSYGGAGGGGWYGGGGGCYQESNYMGGGGGGSGYIGGAGVSNASTTGLGWFERFPANSNDVDNGGAGTGGIGGSLSQFGQPGKVIITPNADEPALPFQEKDSSGNRHHGTLVGTSLVTGVIGKARSFNGTSDYIEIGTDDRFNFIDTFSFEAWINPSSLAGCGNPNPGCIIANKENMYEWALNSDGNLFWAIMPSWTWVNTGLRLSPNKWSHIAIVHDGKFVTSYLNGGTNGIDKVVKTGFIDKSGYSLRIGNRSALNQFFAGKMDEVRFDNVARSQSDIYESYLLGARQSISKTISSTDLSGKNTLPFYVAADRPGTYLQASVAQSDFAAGQPDANTVGLWHLDNDPPHFTDTFNGTIPLSSHWTEFDPNGNKISQTGALLLSGGTVAAWDSGVISTDSWTRAQGLTLYGRFTTGSSVAAPNHMMVGFALNNTGVASYTNVTHALYFATGALYIYQDGASIAGPLASGYAANTIYEVKITLKETGHAAYAIKGGAYTNWTTIYAADTYKTNSPLRVQVAQYQHSGYFTELSVYPSLPAHVDSSIYKNHGTSGGSTTTDGKIGKGQYFNGITDSILVNSNMNLANNSFTIDAWAKRTTTGRNDIILGTSGFPNTNRSLHFGFRNTNVFICAFYGNDLDTTEVYTDLDWHHWACTYNASNNLRRIYRDGVLIAQNTATADMIGNGYVTIGRIDFDNYSTDSYFNGILDEVRVSNIARTATEIRQTYEAGTRSHPITIDFGGFLDNGDLITNSADTAFNVDATLMGLTQKGSMLFKGDKIIVRQVIDNIEYLAQGTVTAVNASTGAVTIAAWDAGSTFPPLGYTNNANVFKWQREYWNVTEPLDDQVSATTKLSLRITGGGEGRTVWIDDLKSNTDYLTDPAGSTIASSTNNRYFQYRAILNSFDEAVTATLSAVTVDYVPNNPPNIPTLDLPTDGAISQPYLTVLKTTTVDAEVDYIQYKIELCENLAMTTNCQTFDQSASQTGWSGQDAQSGTAYASGTQATYTLQLPLNVGATYYWRSSAIDPGGVNVFGNTQPTPFSFTTNARPAIPTLNAPADTATGVILLPVFQTTTTDVDGDPLDYFLTICTNPGMSTNCQEFEQLGSQTGWSGQDALSGTAYASGTQATYTLQAALTPNTTYYWKTSAIDPTGSNEYGSTQATPFSFTTSILPNIPTLDSPADGATGVTVTPTFLTTGTDNDNDYLRYRIRLCLNENMTVSCQTYDQTVSQTGWSGQDTQSGTAYASGTQASHVVQTPLLTNTIYYWKTSAVDPAGTNTFGSTQASPRSFTTLAAPAEASTCTVEKDRDNTRITIRWTDNSQSENGYQIWKVTDGGAPEHLTPDFAANTTSYTDTNVVSNHTYGYLVRSFQYDGQNTLYSNWCPTATSNLFSGGFTII